MKARYNSLHLFVVKDNPWSKFNDHALEQVSLLTILEKTCELTYWTIWGHMYFILETFTQIMRLCGI